MILFGAILSLISFILVAYTESFLVYTVYGTSIFYIMWGGYHLVVALAGYRVPKEVPYETLMKDPQRLPKISIIIPAMNEPILARTIEACLNHTDYPLEKKEILVVVDDIEGERIGFWYQQKYPQNIKLLSRRKKYPTKPSALNDSIHLCTGEIIGIMDVEDIPDRDVFLKAAHALSAEGSSATQAILRISNPQDSWVSNIFSMEYAGWFRVLLNGRARLGLYAPLGGTGNYFRRSALVHVGLYDSTNLAEDAELSIRLRIAGWNVGVLNSRHWEEAPVEFKPWLKQRTRWYRGWLQSLWKYIPIMLDFKSVKRMGLVGAFSTLMMLVAPLIVILNWVSYGITLLWVLEITQIIPVHLMTSISFPFWTAVPVTFNALYLSIWLKGAKLEGIPIRHLHKLLPQMVWYMNLMMPIAATRALYQEIFKPVMWEKTTHEGRGVMWGMVKG
jgi:cellulose synthase/poly-beta-1,6-N-acetylglucosamine synthase-like glycosyltransferase